MLILSVNITSRVRVLLLPTSALSGVLRFQTIQNESKQFSGGVE